MSVASGSQGYAEAPEARFAADADLDFSEKFAPVLHLFPESPGRVLDLGSCTGFDAAELARRGHRVLAVEPTDCLRTLAIERHAHPCIEWLDDSLPELATVREGGQRFDLVLASAVWMHLDGGERSRAMDTVAPLLRPGGRLILSLRHGPVPTGRRMFSVTARETTALAARHGLRLLLNQTRGSILPVNRANGVTWTWLAFARAPGPPNAAP